MTLTVLAHHLLLAAALIALVGASLRIACRLSPLALERIVVATVFAAAIAIIEALALGLVHLGGSPVALFCAAAAFWLTTRSLPAPERSLGQQLAGGWERLPVAARVSAGALAGVVLAWAAWLLRYPAYDFDSLTYHIPEVVTWVQNGAPGSIEPVLPGWPVGNYPLANEVLLSWGSAIGRSFVWLTVWPTLMFALLAASGWLGLRALRVPALAAGLATASVCATPMATSYYLYGANTDFPALVWLVAGGALCAAATRVNRAELLLAALLAFALSVGTKTTTAPLAVIAFGIAAYRLRVPLRQLRLLPVALALAGAVIVGGSWYMRNLIEHGSPTWPLYAAPWGDPAPHLLQGGQTFFQRPIATLRRFGDAGYVKDTFLGGLLILGAAIVAGFLQRRRAVVSSAVVTALSVFLWMQAPDTGAPSAAFDYRAAFYGSPRYLVPGVAAAALTVALAARERGGRDRRLWVGVLALVLLVNVSQLFELGFPHAPSVSTPLVGAVLAGATAIAIPRRAWRRVLHPATIAAVTLGFAAVLAVAAPGLTGRHARIIGYGDGGVIRWFDGPGGDRRPIFVGPLMDAMLAGNTLSRTLKPIPRREPCSEIVARAQQGWVVVEKVNTDTIFGPSTLRPCVRTWRPVFEDTSSWVYDDRSLVTS